MRKRRKDKKTNSKDRRLLAMTIASFFVFAFLVGFINVGETNIVVTGKQTFISDMFTTWTEGNLDLNIAKYLLWIMLTILLFSIFTSVGFPSNFFARWLISIPVGFLSIAYITPSEIFSIVSTYSALGITLSVILPFFIVLFFSASLMSVRKIRDLTTGRILAEVGIWILFTAFLIYKLIAGMFSGNSFGVSMIILGFTAFLSLMIVVLNRTFRGWIMDLALEIRRYIAERGRHAREEERRAGEDEGQAERERR